MWIQLEVSTYDCAKFPEKPAWTPEKKAHRHLAGSLVNLDCFGAFSFDRILQWWSMRKFETHKNNIAQLNFILGRAKLCWKISSWLMDAPDIYRFRIMHMVKTHFLLENLWISGESLGTLEKFQLSSAIPNDCVVLFLCQKYWSFVYTCKHIFSQITMVKPLKKDRIYLTSCTVIGGARRGKVSYSSSLYFTPYEAMVTST